MTTSGVVRHQRQWLTRVTKFRDWRWSLARPRRWTPPDLTAVPRWRADARWR